MVRNYRAVLSRPQTVNCQIGSKSRGMEPFLKPMFDGEGANWVKNVNIHTLVCLRNNTPVPLFLLVVENFKAWGQKRTFSPSCHEIQLKRMYMYHVCWQFHHHAQNILNQDACLWLSARWQLCFYIMSRLSVSAMLILVTPLVGCDR